MNNHAKSGRNQDERNQSSGILLHQNTAFRRQGDCDRSSIRVFEAQLASQPYGDWLSGSRNAQNSVSQFIIRIAKENGLYIPEEQLPSLGERKRLPSGESVIYENAAQGIVYKVRNPFAKMHLKSSRAIDILYDHIVHNLLFPEAQYRLIGITSTLDEVRFVLAQQFFYTRSIPTQQQIEDHLLALGMEPEDKYYYGNEYLGITDVDSTSDNVLLSEEGNLLFIDPIIKIKKPFDEILHAYPFQAQQSNECPHGLLNYIKKLFSR